MSEIDLPEGFEHLGNALEKRAQRPGMKERLEAARRRLAAKARTITVKKGCLIILEKKI